MPPAEVEHSTSTFTGVGGVALHQQCWRTADRPRAVVALVHGVGEHSGRYPNVVRYLAPRGFAVCGYDHRGHGRSAGRRGHIRAWSEYRMDLQVFLEDVRRRYPGIPLFLFGHSMGALVVLDYVLRGGDLLAGVAVSAAPLTPAKAADWMLIALARVLSPLWPTFSLPSGIPPTMLTRDPAAMEAILHDPLVHQRVTVRWGMEILATIRFVNNHPRDIRQPLLMLHGDADRVNTIGGTLAFFAEVTHPDKTLRVYPGSRHEPHNDLDASQVVADLHDWLESHLPE